MAQKRRRLRRYPSYGPNSAMRDITDMSKMAVAGVVGIGMLGAVAGAIKK